MNLTSDVVIITEDALLLLGGAHGSAIREEKIIGLAPPTKTSQSGLLRVTGDLRLKIENISRMMFLIRSPLTLAWEGGGDKKAKVPNTRGVFAAPIWHVNISHRRRSC